jgi:hypothetical protein
MTTTQGIIYTAIGQKYIEEAKLSAKSVKNFCPSMNITLFTDTPEQVLCDFFDQVLKTENTKSPTNQYMIDRLNVLLKTPYDYTLALDTDTYIMDDLSEMFKILNRFDLALCHGHMRFARYVQAVQQKQALPEIPEAMSTVNGGLILYNKNPITLKFLEDLIILYKAKQYYDDQISIRELLWTSDLRFYVLPREYNFNSLEDLKRWERSGWSTARPKLFHYTVNKGQDIEKILQPYFESLAAGNSLTFFQRLKRRLRHLHI